MFWGFANFYRQFIGNFFRIVALLISMLYIDNEPTNNKFQDTKANKNKNSQDAPSSVNRSSSGENIENWSTILKSAKSKKTNLTESKKLDLAKKPDFAKINSSKKGFLILETKKAFIYL